MKLRIPNAWEGRLHSAEVRYWLSGFLQRPHALPPDPGAGEVRVSLSVPPRAIKILERVTGDSASGALRRLIVERLRALPPAIRRPAPALPSPVQQPPARAPRDLGGQNAPLPSSAPWVRPPSPMCRMGPGAMSWDTSYKVAVMRVGNAEDPALDLSELDLPSGIWVAAVVLAVGVAAGLWLKSSSRIGSAAVAVHELPRFKLWMPRGA